MHRAGTHARRGAHLEHVGGGEVHQHRAPRMRRNLLLRLRRAGHAAHTRGGQRRRRRMLAQLLLARHRLQVLQRLLRPRQQAQRLCAVAAPDVAIRACALLELDQLLSSSEGDANFILED